MSWWDYGYQIGLHRPFGFAACEAADFLKFLQGRQFLEIFQTELHQKLFCRLVKDRLPDHIFPSGGSYQFAVEQRLKHAGALHAAKADCRI